MNRTKSLVITLAIVFICSCNNTANENKETEQENLYNIEIISKSYSVTTENGNVEKDTVNMIQSMIVDDQGREIENRYYNLEGTISWSDKYEYDEKGNKIGSKYFESDGTQTIYYEYDLDSLGRRIAYRAKDINTDTLLYDGASQYLDSGKIRRDGYFSKTGEFKYNFEYQYDEDGNETGYKYIDLSSGDEFPSVCNYTKFNKKGEWVEKEIIENDMVNSIEVREFKIIN